MDLDGIPKAWKLVYDNPLACPEDVETFRLEGSAAISFPLGRMRLESTISAEEGQKANFVLWCPEDLPPDLAVTWEFTPLREPGLAIMFFSANGCNGEDLFDPALSPRTGEYPQYHSGDLNTYHLSYFRRRWPEERQLHTCNLRKSYGFHLVAQGADPIPGVADAAGPYRMLLLKEGARLTYWINDLLVLDWTDDGHTYGPLLGGGKIGFRQMAPLIAEYSNLKIYVPNH